jgi:hypothetical protein
VSLSGGGNHSSGHVFSLINCVDVPNPGLRRHEGSSAQGQGRGGAQTIRQAAPGPVLGPADEAHGECVPLDVPADAEQPIWSAHGLQRAALEVNRRPFQAWASPLQPSVMGSCYPCDQPCESRCTRGTEHEVPVIVHDGVREQREWMPFEPFTHNLQEVAVILRPEKHRGRERGSMNHVKVAVVVCLPGGSQHGVGLCH